MFLINIKMNNWFKSNGIHLAIAGFFVVLCFVYFAPAFQGKVLMQSDVQKAEATQSEIMKYKAEDGIGPLWTNSMFGGMPTYQIWVKYPSNVTTYVISALKAVFPNPVDIVLIGLLGTYFLMIVLGLSPWMAVIGAISFAFSSYNFIFLEAGHSNQAMAISFFPAILASVILTLRGKYWLGAGLTAFFIAMEIRSNHIQMTYYLAIALFVLVIFEFFQAKKSNTLNQFGKSFAILTLSVLLAVAVNASSLWTTYEYSKLSTRGKSNITTDSAQPNAGLDKEYAYQWSQGIGETITLLIPNAYGGASMPILTAESQVAKAIVAKGVDATQAAGFAQQMPVYWGPKPFTSGPWYFGAFIFFLFVFGLFIVKNKLKWWLLAATVLSIFLSFGKNFSLFSDLFFNYFPLYNKFRSVEFNLVIASLCVPILACLAIFEASKIDVDQKELVKKLKLSAYIVLGTLLVLLGIPTLLFSFKAETHQDFLNQLIQMTGGDQSFGTSIAQALVEDRISLFRADAIRSLLFIIAGIVVLWALINKKIAQPLALVLIGLIVLSDLWSIDKRYLNDEKFVAKSTMAQQITPRTVDEFILRDKDPNYRVFDLTTSSFQSADASYFHKSIGGYHAAKLKRFQEMVDKQFTGSINQDILDMLNTKYFITQGKEGQDVGMQVNPTACGNAWFVPSVQFVKDNDQEMQAISSFNPKKEAIVHQEFKSLVESEKVGVAQNGGIVLTSYHPDLLKYEYTSDKNVVAVFSEIWYPKGWKMYVDGEEKPCFRANYILRAAVLPGGNHKVEWRFEPQSYFLGEKISLFGSIVLTLILGFAIYHARSRKQPA
jgi:xanthosine utilization system XapX-like protein